MGRRKKKTGGGEGVEGEARRWQRRRGGLGAW